MATDPSKMFAALRILVVDDVQSARWTTKHILGAIGFRTIEEARSGREALNRLRRETFHVVLSDWDMADMHGLALFEEMAEESRLRQIPFVMVTGSVDTEKVKQAITKGIHAYVIKPVAEQALRSAIGLALTKVAKL